MPQNHRFAFPENWEAGAEEFLSDEEVDYDDDEPTVKKLIF